MEKLTDAQALRILREIDEVGILNFPQKKKVNLSRLLCGSEISSLN